MVLASVALDAVEIAVPLALPCPDWDASVLAGAFDEDGSCGRGSEAVLVCGDVVDGVGQAAK